MSRKSNSDLCYEKPCQSKEYERPNDPKDANAEVRGRPVLYTGVVWIGMLRRFLIPRSCGSALPPSHQIPPAATVQDKHCAKKVSHPHPHAALDSRYSRVPQLSAPPLLTTNNPNSEDDQEFRKRQKSDDSSHSPLASLLAQVQEASASAREHIQELTRDINGLVEEGRITTSEAINTLRHEDAVQFRWTMIMLCGLAGYVSGLRRGSLTRVVYSVTGATAMATICYPQEARHYNSQGLMVLRQCIMCGIALIKHGPERGPALGKDKYKNLSPTDSTKPKSSDDNILTQPPNIHRQAYSPKTSFASPTENFGNVGLKYEEVNSQISNSNEPYAEPAQHRNLQSFPPHLTHKSSSLSINSGEPLSNPSSNHGRLSHECEKVSVPDNSIPFVYPPTYNANQDAYSLIQKKHSESQEQTTITDGADTKLHTYITHDPSCSPGIHIIVGGEGPMRDDYDLQNHNTSYELIPTAEPILVIEEENISNTVLNQQEDGMRNVHPLNKKLSRYYFKKPAEIVETADKQ